MISQVFPKSICVDTNFLVHLLDTDGVRFGQETRARLDFFLASVDKFKSKLVIPTPVYAEFLVKAETTSVESLKSLQSKRYVEVASFDLAAAFECSLLDRSAINGSNDKKDGVNDAWQKIKIDRQVVAIAKSRGCTAMITHDASVSANCLRVNINVLKIESLPLPPDFAQKELPLVQVKTKKTSTHKKIAKPT